VTRSGLEVLLDDPSRLEGLRVGFCCNHTAVDANYRHGIDRLLEAGVQLVRLFGPEHGVRATAQDMEGVDEVVDPVTGLPTISLYGHDEASLRPRAEHFEDLDVILFDIQDIGARYYTYQATLGYIMETAVETGTKVIVLDRPNPINGVDVEGNIVRDPLHSFVGAFPITVRHGMTVGELGHYFRDFCGIRADLEVIACEGWRRGEWFDETGLPWVYPSPNMPTLETATIYPGMCLLEATVISEGRGTTRPFHLFGAPWIDPQALVAELERCAVAAGLQGVAFRPAAFVPGFQKHARVPCQGAEVHVVDRDNLNALLLGLVVVQACHNVDPENFAWRPEPYEFIKDQNAIDLLTGDSAVRAAIEAGEPVAPFLEAWEAQRQQFLTMRAECLIYPI